MGVTFALLRCASLGGVWSRPNAEDSPMTTQKDFKRLVRGRMQKTGESYTAARAVLLRQGSKATAKSVEGNGHRAAPAASPAATKPEDFAKLAGMSEAKIKESTGCTWERWVWTLDQVNAHNWPHREIAEYVKDKYKVPDWWTQAVTVGYERIKGLRAKGQRRSGSWEASKSKTMDAPVGKLFRSFKQPKLRAAWLNGARVVVRTSVPNKSVRMTWEDGSSVEAYFTSKGRSKSVVAVQHTKLESRVAADRMKAFWGERLETLSNEFGAKA